MITVGKIKVGKKAHIYQGDFELKVHITGIELDLDGNIRTFDVTCDDYQDIPMGINVNEIDKIIMIPVRLSNIELTNK